MNHSEGRYAIGHIVECVPRYFTGSWSQRPGVKGFSPNTTTDMSRAFLFHTEVIASRIANAFDDLGDVIPQSQRRHWIVYDSHKDR